MRMVVVTSLLAGATLMGCAVPDKPWPLAKTAEECRYEHRKEDVRIRNIRATTPRQNAGPWWITPVASGIAKGVSNSQNDQMLAACLTRVGATSADGNGFYTTPGSVKAENRGYEPLAGCHQESSVMQGGSSYCVR
jgi:hypothetical protein